MKTKLKKQYIHMGDCICPDKEHDNMITLSWIRTNDLEVNGYCRQKLKGLKASGVIVLAENEKSSLQTYYINSDRSQSYSINNHVTQFIEVYHGKYYLDGGDSLFLKKRWRQDNSGLYDNVVQPIHKTQKVLVGIAVEGYSDIIYAKLVSKKDIPKFKRYMRKLFGYDMEYTVDLKYNRSVKPNKLIDCYFGVF